MEREKGRKRERGKGRAGDGDGDLLFLKKKTVKKVCSLLGVLFGEESTTMLHMDLSVTHVLLIDILGK